MEQRIVKIKNPISGNDNIHIYNNDHKMSWNLNKSGFSQLGVVKTHACNTVNILAVECPDEGPTREVRFEIDFEGAKAVRDLLDQIIEKEQGSNDGRP